MDFITGDCFKILANFQYAPETKNGEDYDNLQNTLDISKVKDNDIIYTHTFYAKKLFEIISKIDTKLIIITHNSDQNVDESYQLPDNVIKWYAQNVNVVNPRIESIPIGLENDRWFPELRKKEKITNKNKELIHFKNLVYMNHNIANNPAKRQPVYDLFKCKSWVTTEEGRNGQNFDGYIDNIYHHKYVICPEGNGMDTHRTWETLYLGTIPIEKRNINNFFHEDMPILLVDEWEEITESLLREKWADFFCNRNIKKLTFEYWKNKIVNHE
jgi:hypothetical protein